jgi:hypothetical protein
MFWRLYHARALIPLLCAFLGKPCHPEREFRAYGCTLS